MKSLAVAFLSVTITGFCQTPPDPQTPEQTTPQQTTPAADTTGQQQDRNRSVLEVKPGGEAIKQKDLWEKSGYLHPFRRMPKYVLVDQKAIWTSPFHLRWHDSAWLVPLAGATGVLIGSDQHSMVRARSNTNAINRGSTLSDAGGQEEYLLQQRCTISEA